MRQKPYFHCPGVTRAASDHMHCFIHSPCANRALATTSAGAGTLDATTHRPLRRVWCKRRPSVVPVNPVALTKRPDRHCHPFTLLSVLRERQRRYYKPAIHLIPIHTFLTIHVLRRLEG